MIPNISDTIGANRETRRSLSPTATERLAEYDGKIPVWIRAPKSGPEFYCGFSRAKLYEGAAKGHFRSVSIREPGAIKGTRLFHLAGILAYIERCETEATTATTEAA